MKLSVLRKHLEEFEKAALEKGNTDPDVTFYSSPYVTLIINEDTFADHSANLIPSGDIQISLEEV